MIPKPRNIIVFAGIAGILILVYVFFVKKDEEVASLVSSSDTDVTNLTPTQEANGALANDFLTLLLNVRSIKLNNSIFSDPAFLSLRDSSITLTPDGTEGRPNPFAPIGVDLMASPPVITPTIPTTPPTSGGGVTTPPKTGGTTTKPPTSGTTTKPPTSGTTTKPPTSGTTTKPPTGGTTGGSTTPPPAPGGTPVGGGGTGLPVPPAPTGGTSNPPPSGGGAPAGGAILPLPTPP